ncbi:peptide ABC transporter substrate-binding protein [Porphyrobacter algicida]|uniref:Peptide ABC transporter substrate-binding protein n=1 Tax=Qipengyuania algicida TaxID=1836209 RepID=A0A845AEG6_9SPHN|nr:ABC transporter substrate-binding protein [Qipengyuania algicida]MXP27789.1 peptide ABC transporter substrate-binding protein [Qipengyuania algicida]
MNRLPLFSALLLLSACQGQGGDGDLAVALIGNAGDLNDSGLRLSYPASQVYAASHQGLVRFDANGQLVPGVAERWIVTDDGLSYIFRIREFDLHNGKRLTAKLVQQSLQRTLDRLSGTSLGLDLAPVRDIRAMTGRVIEIRLDTPMPGMLQLLAQPELGLAMPGLAVGPMVEKDRGGTKVLSALPPEQRGLPQQPDWDAGVRRLVISTVSARHAVKGFSDADFQLVLGGRLSTLPLIDLGPLSRGTIRVDSPLGLFGLDVVNAKGFLASPNNREALAMALDRAKLIAPFNISGWPPTNQLVAPRLASGDVARPERWADMDFTARQAEAARRIARWKAKNRGDLTLSVVLPAGPGSDTLFQGLAQQYAAVGIKLVRAKQGAAGDLQLRDRVARFAGKRWFLDQFNCRVSRSLCSPDADALVAKASKTADPHAYDADIAQATQLLTDLNGYIPIGAPVRWSLVRAGVEGFSDSAMAMHPLFPLSRAPI